MKRITISILIGTLILFIWNAISWMVLPFHSNTLINIPETAFDKKLLQESLPDDGVYHYPGIPEDSSVEGMTELENKLKEGPRITLMVYKKGETGFFNPKSFALNLLFNLLTVSILLTIVRQFQDKSIKNVLKNSILIGIMIGLVSDLPQMNWYMFPAKYTLTYVFDHITSFLFLGLLFGLYTFKTQDQNE